MKRSSQTPVQSGIAVLMVVCASVFALLYYSAIQSGFHYEGSGASIVSAIMLVTSPIFFLWAMAWIIGFGLAGSLTQWFAWTMMGIGVCVPAWAFLIRLFH